MKKLFFLFAFLLLLSTSGYSQSLNISSETIKDSSQVDRYEITVSYPAFDFGPNALMGIRGVAGDMNTDIKNMIMSEIDTFKTYQKENLIDLKQYGSEILKEDIKGYLDISYDVKCKSDEFVSIIFYEEQYSLGAAHPNHSSFVYNYSMTDGNLKLSDLFNSTSGYLRYLSQYTRTDLKKQFSKDSFQGMNEMLNEGTTPVTENFSHWTIDGNNLVIHFDPYAVAAYAYGPQEVTIPKSKLSKYLNSKTDVWGKCK